MNGIIIAIVVLCVLIGFYIGYNVGKTMPDSHKLYIEFIWPDSTNIPGSILSVDQKNNYIKIKFPDEVKINCNRSFIL